MKSLIWKGLEERIEGRFNVWREWERETSKTKMSEGRTGKMSGSG